MILVHHLRIGRSLFTVWLLEELGIEYDLKIYIRDPQTSRAREDLLGAHPLGKSPVIEDDGMVIAESGAIATYLVDRYDTAGRLAPPRDAYPARAAYTQWLHYPEGSLFMPLFLKRLVAMEPGGRPALIGGFADGEVGKHLDYIRDALGDKPFLLGDTFQAPDIGLSYALELARRIDVLSAYPTLDAYLDRNLARPAFRRAAERTGEPERAR